MVNYGINWCHFCFKSICGPKANNSRKCLILLATVLLIREYRLSLFTLLNTGLSRQICFEMLMKLGDNTFQ